MEEVGTGLFTVCVFLDSQWAEKGLDALKRHNFVPESLSILGAASPQISELMQRTFGTAGRTFDVRGLGSVMAHGTLVEVLERGDQGLSRQGLAAVMGRVGFQAHDGMIFEKLTARGGVLVAIHSEPRAADALAVLHAYGGGNAAIGAWAGRV